MQLFVSARKCYRIVVITELSVFLSLAPGSLDRYSAAIAEFLRLHSVIYYGLYYAFLGLEIQQAIPFQTDNEPNMHLQQISEDMTYVKIAVIHKNAKVTCY